MYAVLKGSEDGEPFSLITHEDINTIAEYYGIKEFKDAEFLRKNPETNYWEEGVAVLMDVMVIVPKPVTSKWSL
jgi:hypothetical protein